MLGNGLRQTPKKKLNRKPLLLNKLERNVLIRQCD
jgi:hypothetical protein